MNKYINQKDDAYQKFIKDRQTLWNRIAILSEQKKDWSSYYHRRLQKIYQYTIPVGSKVLEIGSGKGDLLASVKPEIGIGVDLSEEMIRLAEIRHPQLKFIYANAQELPDLGTKFDFIILSDLVNDLWDVQDLFIQLRKFSASNTRIIINYYSRLWEIPLRLAQKLSVAKPFEYQNWLTHTDLDNLLQICDFEVIRSWTEILFPFQIPIISPIFNRFFARIWPFNHLCMTNFIVARPVLFDEEDQPSVSVVIAARNEAGNIENIFERVPEMGSHTEIIFVEGHSHDNTFQTINENIIKFNQPAKVFQQKGNGKGDAIRLGFEKASGDILMILDADLTVPPEDLPRFYDAIVKRKGDFINGVRLVYPMEKEAMRFFNFLGNKFFSLAFSWLLGQSIKDTLCGTKVLWKTDYEKIAKNRTYFGDFDPFGDFDLIFGSAKLNHKIVDLPIRYRDRTYGSTNIQRWKHGVLLLRMLWVAANRIKFI
jgi:hypothetical protein